MVRFLTTTLFFILLTVSGVLANCNAPTGLQSLNNSDGVLLSWNAAPGAISYWLKVENANNNPHVYEIEIPVNATSYLVSNLNANASYKFKVRTRCNGDKSNWTEYVAFQTASVGGGTGGGNNGGGTGGICAIPEGLTVSNITDGAATLTWAAVAGAQQYEVEVEDNENTAPFAFNTLTSEITITVTGLAANGQYQVKVKSKCGSGLSSDYSAWVFFNTTTNSGGGGGTTGGGAGSACDIPTNLAVSNLTSNSAILSWSPVAGALRYEVEVEDNENTPLFSFNVLTTDTTIAVIGLAAGGSYQFKVKSKCASDSSEYANWVFFGATTTGGGTGSSGGTGACATPVNLQVSEITATSVKLSWSPVAGALRYEVEVEDDENTPAFSFDALTANTAVLIIGLTPGGNYQFKVKSKCGGGQSSEYSDWTLFTTAPQLVMPATGLVGFASDNLVQGLPAFQIYPNPAASTVAVQWNEPTTEILSLSVVNAQGRQMMRYNNIDGANGRIELPVSNLDTGLYMVLMSNGKTTQSKQLLIVK